MAWNMAWHGMAWKICEYPEYKIDLISKLLFYFGFYIDIHIYISI
jgi:hypothetical protein